MIDLLAIFLITVVGCGLLFILILLAMRISGRLGRIEKLLEKGAMGGSEPMMELVGRSDPAEGTEAQRKEFEEFIKEDKSRRDMPKKKQFAAYRAWRKERGLTWGAEKTAQKQ